MRKTCSEEKVNVVKETRPLVVTSVPVTFASKRLIRMVPDTIDPTVSSSKCPMSKRQRST